LTDDKKEEIVKLTKKLREGAKESSRESAAKALAKLGEEAKEAIPDLISAMKSDPSAKVRGRAALALGRMNDKSTVPDMIKVMQNDADPQVRSRIAWALGDLGDVAVEAIEPLKKASKLDENKEREFYFIISTAKLEGSDSDSLETLKKKYEDKELETWQIIRYNDLLKQLDIQDKIKQASEGISTVKEEAKTVQAEMNSLRKKVESQAEGETKTDLLSITSILQNMISNQQKTIEQQEITIRGLNESLKELVKTHQQTIADPRITPEQFKEFQEQEPKESWFKRNLFALLGALGTLLGGIAAVLGWLSSSLGWFGG
jgi:hypothetical protein